MNFIRIKICGVTTPADARMVVEAGADAVGLNFAAQSPRSIDEPTARAITRALPPFTTVVGVFVETPLADAVALARRIGLHAIQTYVEETYSAAISRIAAFRVKEAADLDRIRTFVKKHSLAAILIDSCVPGEMGGTGHVAPWQLLADFHPGVPLILAGGLTPENVAEAIRIVRPWGVDVASGVESSPGVKDPGKVRAFIAAVHGAARLL